MSFIMLFIPSGATKDLETILALLEQQQDPSGTHSSSIAVDAETRLKQTILPYLTTETLRGNEATAFLQIKSTLLLRPTHHRPGLMAYHLPKMRNDDDDSDENAQTTQLDQQPNRRATCLAMTCGLFQCRFFGNVLIDFVTGPGSATIHCKRKRLLLDALVRIARAGALISPDRRLWDDLEIIDPSANEDVAAAAAAAAATMQKQVTSWILGAAHENYHDQEAVQRWTQIITSTTTTTSTNNNNNNSLDEDDEEEESRITVLDDPAMTLGSTSHEFVTKEPLCLQCRRPTRNRCEGCQGAYFCNLPRNCRTEGWSHDCLCSTWKFYVDRRSELSSFPFQSDWYMQLVTRACQVSNDPYEDDFLTKNLKVPMMEHDGGDDKSSISAASWWATERHGWSGGESASAKRVRPEVRVSYTAGFSPLKNHQIPHETVVAAETWQTIAEQCKLSKNEAGLYRLLSWTDYYQLRGIEDSSPAALLLTFPVSLYYALVEYGSVHWTVARMLNRPLRIDIVGAEKELNFLDLFQELAFLLAGQINESSSNPLLELIFVVRKDMLPALLVGQRDDGSYGLDLKLSNLLRVRIVEGTYGESLNPNLDCGSRISPPDMLMAFNAGLYAYESWRSVLKYLKENSNVVGVFTDYNEWSGVQCASLGGSRETLRLNPFRQPRAMPVYSMNLPQFSNGFIYAINPQETE